MEKKILRTLSRVTFFDPTHPKAAKRAHKKKYKMSHGKKTMLKKNFFHNFNGHGV